MTVTAQLFNVIDYVGSVSVGGSAVTVPVTAPGQVGRLSMDGTGGQQVTVRLTGNTIGWVTVKLLKPDGSPLTQLLGTTSAFNLSTVTLPTSGTYTVLIDPYGATSGGSISVAVTSP